MTLRPLLAVALLMMSQWVVAESLRFELSEDAARVSYASPMLTRGMGDSYAELGFAFNEDKGRADDDLLLHFGMGVGGEAGSEKVGIDVGAGVRAVTGDIADQNVLVAGLGGHISIRPEQMGRLGLSLEAFYAPKIVSFLDAEKYSEFQARFEFRFINTGTVYVGYRRMEFDIEDVGDDIEFDKGAFIGLKLGF